jgi:hypothetical protein
MKLEKDFALEPAIVSRVPFRCITVAQVSRITMVETPMKLPINCQSIELFERRGVGRGATEAYKVFLH